MAVLEIKRLSLAEARVLIDGAKRKCIEIGVPMCVAVVDESGNLIAFERMDGAKTLSVGLSQDKAFTAAVSRRPTHEYNEMCKPGNLVFGIHTSSGGRFSTVGGGYPVTDGDAVVGGVGLSGGAAEQDMEVARAALDHFHGRHGGLTKAARRLHKKGAV
jgi:uncharacterized protein GlcG (DUF336 family)